MKLKIIKPCYDQDNKRRLKPGQLVTNLSDFERGRHLAEGNAVPYNEREIERAVDGPVEITELNSAAKKPLPRGNKKPRRRKKANGKH